jgi:hypothetical protein
VSGTAPEGSGLELINHGMDAANIGALVQLVVANSKEYEEWWGKEGGLELAVIVNLEVSLLPHGVDVSFQAFSGWP